MTRFETPKSEVPVSAERAYSFLTDMNNYQKLMPEQVVNWQSTADECSFTIKGMASIGMKIVERKPHSEVKITSGEKTPIKFDLRCVLAPKSENTCEAQLIFEADINPFLKMMIEKPLENFFNYLAERMKTVKL